MLLLEYKHQMTAEIIQRVFDYIDSLFRSEEEGE